MNMKSTETARHWCYCVKIYKAVAENEYDRGS